MESHFWRDIPECAKWDELNEKKHLHLLEGVLHDAETNVYPSARDEYFLYGPEQSLLFRPQSKLWKLTMILYSAVCQVMSKE